MYPGHWSVTAMSSTPAVTLAEVKRHLRIEEDFAQEDTTLQQYVAAATSLVEEMQGRQIMPATVALTLDNFPSGDEIKLPRAPLSSVSSISYVDVDGASQTFATTGYMADTVSEPGRVRLRYGQSWPSARTQPNGVTVTFVAGYSSASAVPATTKQAILLQAAHLYGNREGVSEVNLKSVPMSVERLIRIQQVPEVI